MNTFVLVCSCRYTWVGVGVGRYVGVGVGWWELVGVGCVGWWGIMNSLFNNSCYVYCRYDATIFANFHHEVWRLN